jgi:hypothetical protein
LGGFIQGRLVESEIGEPFHLVNLEVTVPIATAVAGLFGDPQHSVDLHHRLAFAQGDFGFAELGDGLFE